MRYVPRILMFLFLAGALAACQTGISSTRPPASATDTPGSLPVKNVTPTLIPTFPQEATDMTPVTPPNETAEKMVALVKEHLAQRLNIAVDQIVLEEIKSVRWRDASLGCPKPGVDYIQVETPGYNILLQTGGSTYSYHTDETRRFVACNK